jgi:hypothetical protein
MAFMFIIGAAFGVSVFFLGGALYDAGIEKGRSLERAERK